MDTLRTPVSDASGDLVKQRFLTFLKDFQPSLPEDEMDGTPAR